ncbi:MAG: YafY family transcriptional regulator [Pseudonocardia sp.]|nr:YafY family transcriptional regulator [Pseudonocardia sp.]
MASTSLRTLRLLSLLQTHRYWPGDELAARLEVSIRTLRRDVDRLRELGYPVQAQRGVDGGYQLAPGAALPPLVLDDEEAVALAVGLREATQGGAVAGIAESSVRALAKVIQVMPPRLRRRVEALREMTESSGWGGAAAAVTAPVTEPDTLVAVAQACRDTERIEFEYTAASGERTRRHVEPLRLVSLGRRWYLVGYDLTRHDWRSFRLDRAGRPHNTGARFRPRRPPAEDAATFVRNGIGNAPVSYDVEVTVHAPPASVRSVIGRWARVEPAGDDRCVVRMRTDSLDWPAMALGAVGADFTVHSPPELFAHVRDWGQRFGTARLAPTPKQPGEERSSSPAGE